jgi:hypothetical protein
MTQGSRVGCIALRAVVKTLRHTLGENQTRFFGKCATKRRICIVLSTEAAKQICFVREVDSMKEATVPKK